VVLSARPAAYPQVGRGPARGRSAGHRGETRVRARHGEAPRDPGAIPLVHGDARPVGDLVALGRPAGLRLVRRYRPEVLWSTYPIATAHWVGLTLQRLTGLPWVADFRDAMTEDHYPPDPRTRAVCRRIERKSGPPRVPPRLHGAGHAPDVRGAVSRDPPEPHADHRERLRRGQLLRRGEAGAPRSRGRQVPPGPQRRALPRRPEPLAVPRRAPGSEGRGVVSPSTLRVVLRASGEERFYRRNIDERGLADVVFLEPSTDYVETLSEMMRADVLLVFQGTSCNDEIPAKIYEYFRAEGRSSRSWTRGGHRRAAAPEGNRDDRAHRLEGGDRAGSRGPPPPRAERGSSRPERERRGGPLPPGATEELAHLLETVV